MDTDDLSDMAYEAVILAAEELDHSLTIWFGVTSGEAVDEDDYLRQCLMLIAVFEENTADRMDEIFFGEPGPSVALLRATLKKIREGILRLQAIPMGNRSFASSTSAGPDKQSKSLTLRVKALIPFTVLPTRPIVQTARAKGFSITLKTRLTVSDVHDGPEEGGIMCSIELGETEVMIVSVTGLVFPTDLPLHKEVSEYQRARIKRLKKQHR